MSAAVVIISIIAVLIVTAILLKQGSVGRLSEEDGHRPRRDDVVERPAGPDAEPMHPDPPSRAADTRPPPGRGTETWPEEGPGS